MPICVTQTGTDFEVNANLKKIVAFHVNLDKLFFLSLIQYLYLWVPDDNYFPRLLKN